jgi:hypothetical protein
MMSAWIDNGDVMSNWISVDDEMPKSGRRVLFSWLNPLKKRRTGLGIYAKKHTIEANDWDYTEAADYDEETDNYYCPEGWVEDPYESEYTYPVEGITHWMPLPEPPE